MGHTIAVANQKGGSCKSTTAVNVAACLGSSGQRVLLVDADPKGHASKWCGGGAESIGISRMLRGEASLKEACAPTLFEGVDLVRADREFGRWTGEARESAELRRLEDTIRDEKRSWDVILLDTPSGVADEMTEAAYVAADGLLVPLDASQISLEGTIDFIEDISEYVFRFIVGFLLCRCDGTVHSRRVQADLQDRFGSKVLPVAIHESTEINRSFAERAPVIRSAPDSHAAKEYSRAAREVAERMSAAGLDTPGGDLPY